MPLTAKGRQVYAAMRREYGPAKGKQVFYAYAHAHKGLHGRRRKKKK